MQSACRCATGEAWQDIMIACGPGADCADPQDPTEPHPIKGPECGSNANIAYFVTFVFFSSFLVGSSDTRLFVLTIKPFTDAESVRRRHYGQLRLSDARQ